MNTRTKLLSAMLLPGLAMLAGCNQPGDDVETDTPAATADQAGAMDTTAQEPMTTTPPASADMTDDRMADDDMAIESMNFAQMDANQDGGITTDELTETDMLHEHFSVADANADGSLSEAEVEQHRADMGMSDGGGTDGSWDEDGRMDNAKMDPEMDPTDRT